MTRQISEELTRKQVIDPQWMQVSWYLHGRSIFLQERHLETNTCTSRRWIFGADAAERWFDVKERETIIRLVNDLSV